MSVKKLMTWQAWWFGLIGALKGAIATTALSYLTTEAAGLDIKWRQFGIMIGVSALVQGFMYIQKSPMPFELELETKYENIPPTTPPASGN